MSKFINIPAVHFEINAERGTPDAQAKVLEQFKYATDHLDGTGLDLLITCEGVEAIGQTIVNSGPMYNAYRDFGIHNKCTVAGSIKCSESSKRSAIEIAQEFDLMSLDDYLESSEKHQKGEKC